MRRFLPPLTVGLLCVAIAVQLVIHLSPAPRVTSMPLFVPASFGSSTEAVTTCNQPQPQASPAAVELAASMPLDSFLDGMVRKPTTGGDLDRAMQIRDEILDLRNQRHEWNTGTMELSVQILQELDDEQMQWILYNRDRVRKERLERK